MAAKATRTGDAVSAVVVSFGDPDAAERAIESLLAQSLSPAEVLVVDNDPGSSTAIALAARERAGVRVLHAGSNLGYVRACNLAAHHARGEWLFFLNPDSRADMNCLSALLACAHPETGVVGAQVLLPDGTTNAGDNPLHVTGLAWAGRFREPKEGGPPRQVASVSGAALLARTEAYRALGGLCERFFMYYDDTDLCWRMRLAGWDIAFCPQAIAWHDYEFDRGSAKWGRLERNRLWAVLSNYSASTLLLLVPLLTATELAVVTRAAREGWLRELVRAWASLVGQLRPLRIWRRRVQSSRQVSDAELVSLMTGRFETRLVEVGGWSRLNPAVELYRRLVLAVLRRLER